MSRLGDAVLPVLVPYDVKSRQNKKKLRQAMKPGLGYASSHKRPRQGRKGRGGGGRGVDKEKETAKERLKKREVDKETYSYSAQK